MRQNEEEFTTEYLSGNITWASQKNLKKTYKCGYCQSLVTSTEGMPLLRHGGYYTPASGIYICTNCKLPTFIYISNAGVTQIPNNKVGESIANVPKEVEDVYEEARDCFSVGAYTAVDMLCRKLLMHVAVSFGAKERLPFTQYLDYLENKNYITANSEVWVDKIREYANKVNHRLVIGNKKEAELLIQFCGMLLKTNYEYPGYFKDDKK